MKWFSGTIAEAVNTAKTQLSVFLVYVEGDDDVSKSMSNVLDKSSITGLIDNGKFVSIKITKDSEPHKQFTEIYQFVPVPSLFFIQAGTGIPIEIIAGASHSGLENKIIDAIKKCDVKPTSSNEAKDVSSSSNEAKDVPSSSNEAKEKEAKNELSHEEKLERAKQLLAKKNEEKELQIKQEAKEKEKERRKMGQEVLQAERKKQDMELIKLKQEIEMSKKEEAEAKRKVLEQIAQDKAERQKQQPVEKPVTPSTSQAPSVSPINTNIARLQFKLPTGEAKTTSFPAETKLSEVRKYINETIKPPFKEYQLATVFPRREFTSKDLNSDLRKLDLLPSAVILILPSFGSVQVAGPSWFEVFSKMFWDLLQPLFTLSRYIQGFIFGTGNQTTRDTNTSRNNRQNNPPGTSKIQRKGNFATLANDSDDSDENNTWNGNSTQQM